MKKSVNLRQRRDPLELAFARRLKVEKVALELVHAAFAVLADFGVEESAVRVVAAGKEFADR